MAFERITKRDEEGRLLTEAMTPEMLERLAKYEDFHEHLSNNQDQITAQMDQLRQMGKMQSREFKELMSKKLANVMFLSMLESKVLR